MTETGKGTALTEKRPPARHGPHRRTSRNFRLWNQRGETLTETLASLLIMAAALMILAGGISTGAKVNRDADTRYSVVFPPPMDTGSSAFTYISGRGSSEAVFCLTSSATADPSAATDPLSELKERLSYTETGDGGTDLEMQSVPVRVRKTLAAERGQQEIVWRVLYLFETDRTAESEEGAEDGT